MSELVRLVEIQIGTRYRQALGDIESLARNIAEMGLLHPIVLSKDLTLIVGLRRLAAFRKLGRSEIPAEILDLDGMMRGEFAENTFRKGFVPTEIVAVADALRQKEREAAKTRQREGGRRGGKASGKISEATAGEALEHIAKAVGVSRPTINKATEICEAAEADPENFADLRDEMDAKCRVDGAYKKFKARKRAQRVAEKAKHVPEATSRYRLVNAPVAEMMNEPAETVNSVVTDPPYAHEFVHLLGELACGAAHVLKPGGLLICMMGQSWLPEVFAKLQLNPSLSYLWTVAHLTPGGQASQVFPRRVNTFWKPAIVYCKGEYRGDWYGDVTRSDINDNDKRHHHWGQSLSGMRDLMKRFVSPGDVVMDPFLGGGTTAIVALELHARFIGFDADATAIETTRARLALDVHREP